MTLLNPAFMYAATWMFVLFIYSFRLSNLLEPLQPSTIVLVIGTSLGFILGWMIESLPNYGRLAGAKINLDALGAAINPPEIGRRSRTVWIIFGLGISCEIAYFRTVPVLSLIGIGPDIDYSEWGIPGFHGLVNALFYAGCMITFSRILLHSSKRLFPLMMMSIAYPIITLSRQVMISLLVQYMLLYFSIRKPSPRIFVRAGIVFAAVLLLFGYLGDVRSGREAIIGLAAPTFEYPDWLPSAFIWIYIYLSTPLNNVNLNIDIRPSYFPIQTAGSFIPSFARDNFVAFFGGTPQQWDLASSSFNVSSLLQSLVSDFGVGGSIAFALLCGMVFSRLRRLAAESPAAFFAVIVLLHGIALSFFANLLFHLVFMFEILAIIWVVRQGRRR